MREKMFVAFYKGRGPTWFIRFKQGLTKVWTRGHYSHCELIHQTWDEVQDPFKDDAIEMWYGATTYNPDGVASRQLVLKPEHWDIYDISNEIDIPLALEFLRSKIGLRYDWLGIYLSHVIPLGFDRSERYFCSEYLAECLGLKAPATFSPVSLKRYMIEEGMIDVSVGKL